MSKVIFPNIVKPVFHCQYWVSNQYSAVTLWKCCSSYPRKISEFNKICADLCLSKHSNSDHIQSSTCTFGPIQMYRKSHFRFLNAHLESSKCALPFFYVHISTPNVQVVLWKCTFGSYMCRLSPNVHIWLQTCTYNSCTNIQFQSTLKMILYYIWLGLKDQAEMIQID